MSEPPTSNPDDIAPLLRLGLDDLDRAAQTPDATILVSAPTPRSGASSGEPRGWNPPSVEELQRVLPQYEISAFIARGGMGAVYKGTQKALKRPVAIKVLPPEIEDGNLQFAARFKHEAQAMAQLSHPNIVAVFDAGETPDGLLYFVMEFIEGTDVAQLIASEGQLDPLRAIQITTAVCEALAFAHEEGIIHRDIKPSNIMIDRKGRVKVADFGLAKTVSLDHALQTQSNMALGTPDFIAPEALIPGMKVDQRADLYAVGVMLYQMLTGHIPRGRFELPSGVVPQVDKGFDAVVDKAMQTDREKRYSSATEMKTAVERVAQAGSKQDGSAEIRFAASQPLPTSSHGGAAATKKEAGRSARTPLLIGAVAAVAVLGGGAWLLMAKGRQPASVPAQGATQPVQWTNHLLTRKWPEGWQVKNGKLTIADKAKGLSGGLATLSNAAIRVKARAVQDTNLQLQLILRAGSEVAGKPGFTGNYQFQANARWTATSLNYLERQQGNASTEKVTPLWKDLPLPAVLAGQKEIEWEFRALGDELSVLANGQLIKSVRDSRLTTGLASFATDTGLEISKVETANLDGLSKAEALKTAGAPQGTGWIKGDFMAFDPATVDRRAKLIGRQLHLQDRCVWRPEPLQSFQNAAVRVSLIWRDENRDLKLAIGDKEKMHFAKLFVPNTGGHAVGLGIYEGADQSFRNVSLRAPLRAGERVTFQFARIGSTLFTWVNDHLVSSVPNVPAANPGPVQVSAAEARIDSFEYLPLDDLSEAEALKAAGVHSGAPAPVGYPAPAAWIDATPEVRSGGLRNGKLKASGGWLEAPAKTDFILANGAEFSDVATRVIFSGSVTLKLRRSSGRDAYFENYAANIAEYSAPQGKVGISYEAPDLDTLQLKAEQLQDEKKAFPITDAPDESHEMVFSALGPKLSLWMDGRLLISATDNRLAKGLLQLVFEAKPGQHPSRIQRIEYGKLETSGTGSPPSPSPHAPKSAAWQRAAFPTRSVTDEIKSKGGTAMDGALLGVWKDSIFRPYPQMNVQNAAVRITVPAAQPRWPVKLVTRMAEGGAAKQCTMVVWPHKTEVVRREGVDRVLKTFSFPWPLTEGGEFTAQFASIGSDHHVWVNGQFLGSVTDDAHPAPGEIGIQADDGRFHSVETLALDGLSEAEALKVAGLETPVNAMPAPSEWIDGTEALREAGIKDGKLKEENGWLSATQGDFYFKLNEGREGEDMAVRIIFNGRIGSHLRKQHSMGSLAGYVSEVVEKKATLAVKQHGRPDRLSVVNLPPLPSDQKEREMIFVVRGSVMSQWVDGKLVNTIIDEQHKRGWTEMKLFAANNSLPATRVRKLEYAIWPSSSPDKTDVSSSSSAAELPTEWMDSTQALRETGISAGKLKEEDGFLKLTEGNFYFHLHQRQALEDVAVRVTFSGSIGMKLRKQDEAAGFAGYVTGVSENQATIGIAGGDSKNERKSVADLPPMPPGQNEREMIFIVRGSEISQWVDGKRVNTFQDGQYKRGIMELALLAANQTRAATQLRKVEYAILK